MTNSTLIEELAKALARKAAREDHARMLRESKPPPEKT